MTTQENEEHRHLGLLHSIAVDEHGVQSIEARQIRERMRALRDGTVTPAAARVEAHVKVAAARKRGLR